MSSLKNQVTTKKKKEKVKTNLKIPISGTVKKLSPTAKPIVSKFYSYA